MLVQRFILQPLQNEPMMQVFATFGLLILLQNIVLAITRGASLSVRIDLASATIPVGTMQVSVVRLIALIAATVVARYPRSRIDLPATSRIRRLVSSDLARRSLLS